MFNLEKMILKETKYVSGFQGTDDQYMISASMIGNDMLQNYLSIIYGKGEPDDKFGDNTMGTVFHSGMERIVNIYNANKEDDNSYPLLTPELSMFTKLSNGWILSGTADLIVETEPGRYEIRDYKLTKKYTVKKLKEDMTNNSYVKQLQALSAIFRTESKYWNGDTIVEEPELIVDFFVKDSIAAKKEPVHTPIKVPHKSGTTEMKGSDVVLAEVVEITNSLQSYIESGTIPPICKDTWKKNVGGRTIPMRCVMYCDHGKKGRCPRYQPSDIMQTTNVSNW